MDECPFIAEELPSPQARALQPKADARVQDPEEDDGALMASYSVFVVEPGSAPVEKSGSCQDCSWGPVWLLYLCIAFGILFVVMLVINLFLCSAMSCACSKSKEKDVSYLEDFDPYARSWQGSQYGSRYSLSGGIKTVPVPYLPADTTRSVSSTSEYGGGHGGQPGRVSVRPHSRTSRSSKQRGSPTTSGSTSGYSSSRHLVAK